MHIFASGLMGWGIASAWQGKRLRLLGTYVLSVMIHGLWNSAAIIIEVGSLQPYLNNTVSSKSFDSFSLAGTIVLGLLVLLTLPALILINRKMRQPSGRFWARPAQSDIIPPPILYNYKEWLMNLILKLIDFILHFKEYLNIIIAHYGVWTYGLLFFIIFMETGFVITPFLPGDSLIFAAATLSGSGTFNPWLLFILLGFCGRRGR